MNDLSVIIRIERPGDEAAIHDVTRQAFDSSEFGHHGEAELVDTLRAKGAASVSLVAEVDGRVVGHILFSPAKIGWDGWSSSGLGLAPMSVLPEFQRRGIGSRLIEAGYEAVTGSSHEFVIVIGHSEYYSKFGFVPASSDNVTCEFEGIPDEVFLIRWFRNPPTTGSQGVAKYHPVFSAQSQ